MHGDFSRLNFDPANRFSSVQRLQGRVDLDSDDNENTAILLHYMRTLASDLIGPFSGPVRGPTGFEITPDLEGKALRDLGIGLGRYYVDGILVENGQPDPVTYYSQPDSFLDRERHPLPDAKDAPLLLVYLKVFERLITVVEEPETREVALGATGPDSAAHTKVVWQVVATPFVPGTEERIKVTGKTRDKIRSEILKHWLVGAGAWGDALQAPAGGELTAWARSGDEEADPCIQSPFARYRGPENQLYRVEIQTGGAFGDNVPPTFKWSRDNGSVLFPIDAITQSQVTVASLGRDDLLSLEVGQWVELVDDAYALAGATAPLYRVESIDELDRRVTLDRQVQGEVGRHPERHPFLRRWDHTGEPADLDGGAIPIVEDGDSQLEDGIHVRFSGGPYRSGDYWLIPARTEIGDVIWPGEPEAPLPLPPNGPRYHYAPLALIGPDDVIDLRCSFAPLPCGLPDARQGATWHPLHLQETQKTPAPARKRTRSTTRRSK